MCPLPIHVLKKTVILSFLSEFWIHAWVSKSSYLWRELERESSGGIVGIGEGTKAAASHNHSKVPAALWGEKTVGSSNCSSSIGSGTLVPGMKLVSSEQHDLDFTKSCDCLTNVEDSYKVGNVYFTFKVK